MRGFGQTGGQTGGGRLSITRPRAERLVSLSIWMIALTVAGGLFWIVGDILIRGFQQISFDFLTTGVEEAGLQGGILPMMVSTFLVLAIAMIIAIPTGVAVAVLLAEFSNRSGLFATLLNRTLDVLASVPSIVFGLFGNAFFCIWLGLGYSILAGGLTLACMVLPILIRTLAVALAEVPDQYRLAATALGISKTRAAFSILIPMAWPGLLAGVVLGIGRVIAETAALLFTSGYVDRMPHSLLDSGRTLSIHIYDLTMNVAGGEPNAYATALVLIVLLAGINLFAMAIGNLWSRKASS